MKELTIEQKARRYDEALERAKGVIEQNPLMKYLKKGIEYIFHELKESEDERIRKALISILKSDFEKDTTIYDISVWDIITWLEKQGGQKPVVKAEPKFKVGDVIRQKGTAATYTIIKVTDTTYYTKGWSYSIERCEKDYELVKQKSSWSEEDESKRKFIKDELLGLIADEIDIKLPLTKRAKDLYSALCWLKSLKDRVQPQPQQWKPSDEQIKVCKEVYADILSAKGFDLGTVNSELNRLEEELKKLKE